MAILAGNRISSSFIVVALLFDHQIGKSRLQGIVSPNDSSIIGFGGLVAYADVAFALLRLIGNDLAPICTYFFSWMHSTDMEIG